MLSQGSQILLGYTCFFVLLQVTVGIECEPGQKANLERTKCEICPVNQYRPKKGEYVECLNCQHCKNSREIASCTSISNTKCECFKGFSFFPASSVECRCQKGSGIETLENGEKNCKKCPNGAFSSKYNSKCQPWKKCDHNGVRVPGTATTDVVCHTTTNLSVIRDSTPTPPATLIYQTSANISTMESSPKETTKIKLVSTTTTPGSTFSGTKQMQLQHWLIPLCCVLALILIQLAIIKLKVKDKKMMVRQDSTCGKPVEESGEKFIPSAV